jgi:AraC-like DNA-binding protein
MLPFYQIQPSDLSILYNERELYFPCHVHGHFEIIYIFFGTQCIEIDDSSFELHEGEAAIIFPDIMHNYYKKRNGPTKTLMIIGNPKIFGNLFPDLSKFHTSNPIIPKEMITEDAICALNHFKKNDSFSAKFGWTCVVMSHLLEHIELEQQQRIPVHDMTHKIIEYISTNFREPLTLDMLATKFCISKCYISHIFSKKIKMSFRAYLGLMRIEYAAKLIRTTDDTLTTIGINAGFDCYRTFCRAFRKIYDMTPKEYMQNINKYI